MKVTIEKRALKTLKKYPEKSRIQVYQHIKQLEDPYRAPDVECLLKSHQIYRMHVGRLYTIIFRIHKDVNVVQVLDVDTIEQAHKKYGRYH